MIAKCIIINECSLFIIGIEFAVRAVAVVVSPMETAMLQSVVVRRRFTSHQLNYTLVHRRIQFRLECEMTVGINFMSLCGTLCLCRSRQSQSEAICFTLTIWQLTQFSFLFQDNFFLSLYSSLYHAHTNSHRADGQLYGDGIVFHPQCHTLWQTVVAEQHTENQPEIISFGTCDTRSEHDCMWKWHILRERTIDDDAIINCIRTLCCCWFRLSALVLLLLFHFNYFKNNNKNLKFKRNKKPMDRAQWMQKINTRGVRPTHSFTIILSFAHIWTSFMTSENNNNRSFYSRFGIIFFFVLRVDSVIVAFGSQSRYQPQFVWTRTSWRKIKTTRKCWNSSQNVLKHKHSHGTETPRRCATHIWTRTKHTIFTFSLLRWPQR